MQASSGPHSKGFKIDPSCSAPLEDFTVQFVLEAERASFTIILDNGSTLRPQPLLTTRGFYFIFPDDNLLCPISNKDFKLESLVPQIKGVGHLNLESPLVGIITFVEKDVQAITAHGSDLPLVRVSWRK